MYSEIVLSSHSEAPVILAGTSPTLTVLPTYQEIIESLLKYYRRPSRYNLHHQVRVQSFYMQEIERGGANGRGGAKERGEGERDGEGEGRTSEVREM